MEEVKGMSIKNVDKSDGLTKQKIEIVGDVSVMISKSVSNNKSKASNEDPNHGINLFEIFWDRIGNGDSNQAGLETENAEENDIEIDQLLSDMRNSNGESADIWCGNRTYDFGYCDWGELTGDEVGVDKEISLIDFDESNQIDEREPEIIFNAFIEKDLIDFGCVAEESVMNNNVKEEMIDENREINVVVNTSSSKMHQTNNEKFESLPEPSSEVTLYVKFAKTKSKIDIVQREEEIVKDLLKVLKNDEFDCGVDFLSKSSTSQQSKDTTNQTSTLKFNKDQTSSSELNEDNNIIITDSNNNSTTNTND
ncbi:9003_t:CDS:2 [Racocetra fulgida]|uniref:9003_t:CDS:1 n=1 Tax=Racocetra fulgida TaxID=60492 RepID=A0A9N8W9G9_9GLOM|nr:9003_t:CDS:2 [Racocetra fulgida]